LIHGRLGAAGPGGDKGDRSPDHRGSGSIRCSRSARPTAVGRPTRERGQFRGVVRTQHTEQPAHLGQGLPSGGLDLGQHGPGLVPRLVDHEVPVPGLNGDHAHAVRDDVVQLARDPEAFLGACAPGPFPFGPGYTGVVAYQRVVVAAVFAPGVPASIASLRQPPAAAGWSNC
jgi:hypothetical protein